MNILLSFVSCYSVIFHSLSEQKNNFITCCLYLQFFDCSSPAVSSLSCKSAYHLPPMAGINTVHYLNKDRQAAHYTLPKCFSTTEPDGPFHFGKTFLCKVAQ